MQHVDRHVMARELSRGRRVLDIGGVGMGSKQESRWSPVRSHAQRACGREYNKIREAASRYETLDYRPGADWECDLNNPGELPKILRSCEPDVIICMECLEHLAYPGMVVQAIGEAVQRGSVAWFTVPNPWHWVWWVLGWHYDHTLLFTREMGLRFFSRVSSDFRVTYYQCTQRYVPYWWIIYLAGFLQPENHGFLLQKKI